VRCLIVEQYPDGHVGHSGDERPPLSPESGIPGTALSARALRLYPIPALVREQDAAVSRARSYLLSTKSRYGDDYAFRLLGLFWTDAQPEQIAAAARDLVGQQRSDGGWTQTSDMTPDAYATGQALAALATAQPALVKRRGVPSWRGLPHPRARSGRFLAREVSSLGFQPYFDSGFPHGHDQWISIAATAWSAMALMPAAEAGH
jgi:hypothetical protein